MAASWKNDWKEDLGKLVVNFVTGFLWVAGILLLVANGENFLMGVKPAQDVEYLMEYGGAREGMHVTGEIPYVYNCFANLSDTNDSKVSAYYYALPSAEGMLILGIPKEQYKAMEALWEETWDYLEGESMPVSTVPIEGYIEKAKGRLPYLLTEYLTETVGYTQDEVDAMGEPLLVQYASESLKRARIYAPVGVILLASGILLVVLRIFLKRRRVS